ncbi:hypothetical protein VTO73DRAFT_13844 [Trametes versicolor]
MRRMTAVLPAYPSSTITPPLRAHLGPGASVESLLRTRAAHRAVRSWFPSGAPTKPKATPGPCHTQIRSHLRPTSARPGLALSSPSATRSCGLIYRPSIDARDLRCSGSRPPALQTGATTTKARRRPHPNGAQPLPA